MPGALTDFPYIAPASINPLEVRLSRCKGKIIASLASLQFQAEHAIELLCDESSDAEELAHTLSLIEQAFHSMASCVRSSVEIATCEGQA